MKGNNEKRKKWYFLIAVALLLGAIIGYFATTGLSNTGNAKNIINNNNNYLNILRIGEIKEKPNQLQTTRIIKCGCWDGSPDSIDCCPEKAKDILVEIKSIDYEDCMLYQGTPVFEYPDGEGPGNYVMCLTEDGWLMTY